MGDVPNWNETFEMTLCVGLTRRGRTFTDLDLSIVDVLDRLAQIALVEALTAAGHFVK